jgi:predicted DsbA family dithiol-disulfide isomerase
LGGDTAFWKYVDLVYAKTTSNGNGLNDTQMYELAGQAGVDANKVKDCVTSNKYLSHVKADIAEGSKAGVSGTPGNILINNKTGTTKAVHGAQPISAFQAVLPALLK